MNWSRLIGAAAAGLVLCGCASSAGTAGTTGASRGASSSAHGAHKTADDTTRTPAAKPADPLLTLSGNLDARPGQRVDIRLDDVRCAPEDDAVTAESPAFGKPVRLKWHEGACGALTSLAMTAKPGWYPLKVTLAGRTVAHDKIHVVRSQRPSFTLTLASETARPGEPLWLNFDDLYPGERGTDFTVRSVALRRPVRLAHSEQYDYYNPRAFVARSELLPGLADGTYTFELHGPHGHRMAEKRLTVRASRPGDPDYRGKAHGPDLYAPPTGYADSPHGHGFTVRAGGQVAVMWHDVYPDPGEETRLTASSPAFTHVLHLRSDDSKAADGDDPRFVNTATVRRDLKPGRYPVTVVAHHGRVRKTSYLTVTAR
ncbi:hypothetical protein AB0C96_27710 [Streptomyces sp. NPDC048506]|uniref:hypothetical protein n=1 Tax=Streptomyces sp. NPDC048506 TaxID=3155028 RepID=UPI003438666F